MNINASRFPLLACCVPDRVTIRRIDLVRSPFLTQRWWRKGIILPFTTVLNQERLRADLVSEICACYITKVEILGPVRQAVPVLGGKTATREVALQDIHRAYRLGPWITLASLSLFHFPPFRFEVRIEEEPAVIVDHTSPTPWIMHPNLENGFAIIDAIDAYFTVLGIPNIAVTSQVSAFQMAVSTAHARNVIEVSLGFDVDGVWYIRTMPVRSP